MSPDRSGAGTGRIARAPADGRAPPASPAIVGYIDRIDGARVSGWAWDRNQPDLAVDVEIRIGDKVVATVRADRLRKDLARSGTGNGYHAFEAVLGAPIPDADRRLVSAVARVEGQPGTIALVNRASDPPGSEPGAASEPPPEIRRWLDDLAKVQKAFEETLKIAARDIREAVRGRSLVPAADAEGTGAEIEEIRSRQEELARQIAALEVFHARFDAVLRKLERPQAEVAAQEDSGKGLRIAVVVVGLLSLLSLGVGVWSIFV